MPEIGIADKTTLDSINTKVGTSTDGTGVASLFGKLAAVLADTALIKGYTDQVEGYTDTIEGLIGTANPASGDLSTLFKGLKLIADYVDTLENNLGYTGDAANASGTVLARLAELLTNRLTSGRAGYLDAAISSRAEKYNIPQVANFIQASCAADTLYTVLNITGQGKLTYVGVGCLNYTPRLQITVDGVVRVNYSGINEGRKQETGIYLYIFDVEFSTSLKVEVASSGSTNLYGAVDYALI